MTIFAMARMIYIISCDVTGPISSNYESGGVFMYLNFADENHN